MREYRGMRVEEDLDAPNFGGVVWCDVMSCDVVWCGV